MKKQLILFLFLLPFIATGAKTVYKVTNPAYVGINDGTMKITSVATTEKATVVTFQYPGKGFGTFASDTYIEDEQGIRYELIGQKGFSEDSLKRLVPKKKGKYELHFQPLPANTRVFDMIEDFYYTGSTRYYGIREEGVPFSICNPLPHNEGEANLPDIDFKVDSVWVTGRIENYNPEKCKFKKVIKYTPYLAEFGKEKFGTPMAIINEDGTFNARTRVVGPTWVYLLLAPERGLNGVMFIPVMLYPNDSIDLCITADGRNSKEAVKYRSKRNRDFSRLMQCAPMIHVLLDVTPYRKKDTTEYCSFTPENVKKHFEDYDNLGLYLSGKYGLNRVETEMLRSHLSTVLAIDVIGETNSYLQNHCYPADRNSMTKKEWNMAEKKWRDSNLPYYGISFSNLRVESNAFLTIPDWTVLLSTHSLLNMPAYNKRSHDFIINRMYSIYGKMPEPDEDGNGFFKQFEIKYTTEIKEKEKYFEEQASRLYYEWMLQLIREWRGKDGKDDALFEQAYLLCCTRAMPRQHYYSLTYAHQQFIQCKELFYHPSVIRMASELLFNREKECYLELEDEMRRKE